MTQISPTISTAEIERAVQSIGRLSHTDPQELWTFICIAKKNLANEVFWQMLHDELCAQGASVLAADRWVNGMRSLASGRYPT